MAKAESSKRLLVDGLMDDLGIDKSEYADKEDITHEIRDTITKTLNQYNLSTNLTFVEKVGQIKMKDGTGSYELASIPNELKDASFLPVTTMADIALREDLDLIISQIPELFTAVQLARDMICEADYVDGTLSRTIKFDHSKVSENEMDTVMSKIQKVEEDLELHQIIKNHIVNDALLYGESYLYAVPYAKVFEDLWKYKSSGKSSKKGKNNASLGWDDYDNSSVMNGFGYGEHAVEVSLGDTTFVQESVEDPVTRNKVHVTKEVPIFTEDEFDDMYNDFSFADDKKEKEDLKPLYDRYLREANANIHCVKENVSIPVIEASEEALRAVYREQYKDEKADKAETIFESVMNDSTDPVNTDSISKEFSHIPGIYLKMIPSTKMVPIRIDRTIIGYYYVSDMTRPEESGQRKNSGLGGYTLRSPAMGYDTFAPDRLFCDRLATKIIENFDLKFMRDNAGLHDEIVAILEAHKFQQAMLRFIFIPAEHVVQFSINKDGLGKGHSMLEPCLCSARMYMFLKLYSVLFQINNGTLRVIKVRQSGMDQNYQATINSIIRKFVSRKVVANDIFNYRQSMGKIQGGSMLTLPMGTNDIPPIEIENIPGSEAPINTELMDNIKNEAINAQPIPSAMIQGAMSEMEFAKEVELANTKVNSFVSSAKIELNPSVTKAYRLILRWTTDIDPTILQFLKFKFNSSQQKALAVNNELISNFNGMKDLLGPIFMTKEELAADGDSMTETAREFYKLLIAEHIPGIDPEKIEELLKTARQRAAQQKLIKQDDGKNVADDYIPDEGEELM